MSFTRVGGGWVINTGAADGHFNAFCYAGNGCTLLDNRILEPFTLGEPDLILDCVNEGSGSCCVGRQADRAPFSDPRTLCPSGPTDGSVLVCRRQEANTVNILCGTASVLAMQMVEPSNETIVIEQYQVSSDFQRPISNVGIPSWFSDGDCVIQGNKLSCAPGTTWLFVVPNSGDCDGSLEDPLLVTCPRVSGFTQVGCCPASDIADSTPQTVEGAPPMNLSTTGSPAAAPTSTVEFPRVGGGWVINTGAADGHFNAFCYAGNGCTLLDNRISDPFTLGEPDLILDCVNEGSGSCCVGRQADRAPFSDPRTLCPSGPTDGSVLVCRRQEANTVNILCGTASLLAMQMVEPSNETIVIEQYQVSSNFQRPSSSIKIPKWFSDGDCVIQGNKLSCAPGTTWLFVVPNSGDCEGLIEDLLSITCPHVHGFTQIGCCPVSDTANSSPQNGISSARAKSMASSLSCGVSHHFNYLPLSLILSLVFAVFSIGI